MKLILLIICCCLSQLSLAGDRDSCTSAPATESHIRISLADVPPQAGAFGNPRAIKYVPEDRIRHKLHMANVMTYAGGALLLASVPVFIVAAARNASNTSSPNGNRGNALGDVILITGGVLLGGGGLGLMIPGSILRHKYQAKLLNRY